MLCSGVIAGVVVVDGGVVCDLGGVMGIIGSGGRGAIGDGRSTFVVVGCDIGVLGVGTGIVGSVGGWAGGLLMVARIFWSSLSRSAGAFLMLVLLSRKCEASAAVPW